MKNNTERGSSQIAVFLFLLLLYGSTLYADEIRFINGDRISGKVIEENEKVIVLQTDVMGTVSVRKEYVKEIVIRKDAETTKTEQEKPELWKGEVSVGYNEARGNTEKTEFFTEAHANRKTEADEFTIKGNAFYSSSNKKMDSQKWYGLVRYSFSFWEKRWYNFYKAEADHDRFANIGYRLTPSAGIGYWFSEKPEWKLMTEGAVGFEHTNYRDETKDGNEPILVLRAFFQKKLFSDSSIFQDITLYPSLKDIGELRLRSETTFRTPLSDNLWLRFSLIDDYNSGPPEDTKDNDMRFISSLTHTF